MGERPPYSSLCSEGKRTSRKWEGGLHDIKSRNGSKCHIITTNNKTDASLFSASIGYLHKGGEREVVQDLITPVKDEVNCDHMH